MEQTQLIELIKTLNAQEQEQLLQSATLPFNYLRVIPQVAPLLALCFQHTREDAPHGLDKKTVFKVLFPSQPFVESKLNKVMVEAHRIVRAFLLTQHYFRPDNEFEQVFDFAEIVRLRGLHTRHQQLLVQLEKIQEAAPWENARHLHRQFLLEYAIHVDDSFHNKVKGDLHVPESLEALERYYQHCRLGLLCNILLQQKMTHLELPVSVQRLLESSEVPEATLNSVSQFYL